MMIPRGLPSSQARHATPAVSSPPFSAVVASGHTFCILHVAFCISRSPHTHGLRDLSDLFLKPLKSQVFTGLLRCRGSGKIPGFAGDKFHLSRFSRSSCRFIIPDSYPCPNFASCTLHVALQAKPAIAFCIVTEGHFIGDLPGISSIYPDFQKSFTISYNPARFRSYFSFAL